MFRSRNARIGMKWKGTWYTQEDRKKSDFVGVLKIKGVQ